MGKFIDLTGQKFGRLTVVKRAENKGREVRWVCECECGNYCIVLRSSLKTGQTRSCGCLKSENSRNMLISHGMAGTRLYKIWTNMKRRCYSPKSQRYKNYGAKGIRVCNEWKNNFDNFAKWAYENGYTENLTIDRIDINKNYEPSNCRWATWKEQGQNTSRTHWITYNGETHSMSEWADILNINYKALARRITQSKWSIEKAFTTPIAQKKGVI